MPETVKKMRVFLASPGDVKVERTAMREVVDEINRSIGGAFGFVLELVKWETHAHPSMGRPQGIINDLIGAYDIFVGVMWKRFGSPTGVADSGTAEEFERAFAAWQGDKTLPILFYFSQGKYRVSSDDEVAQLGKLVEFRSRLNKLGLVWTYPSASKFADTVRPHLTKLLCDRMSAGVAAASPAPCAPPESGGGQGHSAAGKSASAHSAASAPDANLIARFERLWPHLEPKAQEAFSIAFNGSNGGVKTKSLFAALRAVEDRDLDVLLEKVGDQALPSPTPGDVEDDRTILESRPWFSPCVADSIENMATIAERGESISAADIFVDIAKHGTGDSVMRLRANGISAADVDRLARTSGIRILERDRRSATFELPAG